MTTEGCRIDEKVDGVVQPPHYPPAMSDSTLRFLAVAALFALAACNPATTQTSTVEAPPSPDIAGWRMASGKAPTQAEFAALAATCQAKGGAIDPCFADLGLKRAP
jgi:hypothetical protein